MTDSEMGQGYDSGVRQFELPQVDLPLVDHRSLEAMPGFVVYDAVDYNAVPANATHLLAYLDGAWPNMGPMRARFPLATILGITVTGATKADIGDCEPGDLGPASTAGDLIGGQIRIAYSDDSEVGAILSAHGGPFPWWAAEPTGIPHQNPYSIATQFAWPGRGSPGNYDMSYTDGVWLGWTPPTPAPPPPPLPNPTHSPEDSMIARVPTGGILVARPDGSVFAYDGAQYRGGMNGHPLAAPIVGIASTATGNGYWLVGADAGIFNFGDARYLGPNPTLRAEWGIGVGRAIPVVGIAQGSEPGVAYTIIGDAGPVPELYRISSDGSMV